MDELPPEGRALVAEYFARLRRIGVADIDAKVQDFEAWVWQVVWPLVDSEDTEERAFAQGKLNDLKEHVQSIGAGVREHCLARLPAVVLCLLFSCAYFSLEHFFLAKYLYFFVPQDNSTPSFSWSFLYSML